LRQQAIDNWLRAGEHAIEGSANREAIAHLTRGLKLLEDLPEGSQRDEKELALQLALLTPLFAARLDRRRASVPRNGQWSCPARWAAQISVSGHCSG